MAAASPKLLDDLNKLRQQTLVSGQIEEAVTVNTRALIDKVLARYSGEWTTLRETIQNASDSGATKVTIRFDTIPSSTVPLPSSNDHGALLKHTVLHHTLRRLQIENDGAVFNENDWQRLKRIAEGNPDETKIGAFGVGFYSVFAECEDPFVLSGDQTMAFFWKKDSLFTQRGKNPNPTDTRFILDYRSSASPVPNLLSLCQFLSTSLTFVGLESIELWLDQFKIIELAKKRAPSAALDIPSDIVTKTKENLMKIVAFDYQNAQIDAKWLNVVAWNRMADNNPVTTQAAESGQSLRTFFSRFAAAATTSSSAKKALKEEETRQQQITDQPAHLSTATVFLRVSTVKVQTNVSKTLAAELLRATKKPPPNSTSIAILTASHDETSASTSTLTGLTSFKASEIFASVLPTKTGHIFIGFPTSQSTGLLAHVSMPSCIPTVEREHLDLNARHIRTWNAEMLRVAGIACRIAYSGELLELKAKLGRAVLASGDKFAKPEHVNGLLPAAIHTFNQYTYQESTPSSQVGQIIEEAFWTCNRKMSIDVLSSRGVLPSADVRIASEDLSFVSGIPVVPDEIVSKASPFLTKLQDFGLLSAITTRDIKKELERQALTEAQLTELLKWAARKAASTQLDRPAILSLFDGTVTTLAEEQADSYPGQVLLLGSIDTFPNPARIPADMPMPANTIPFRFVKGLDRAHLQAFGWDELQVVPWLRHLIGQDGSTLRGDQSISRSVDFATHVHPILSKVWDGLDKTSKASIVDLLRERTVIPTKLGLRKPTQAYFASVRLFDDLPTVHGLQGVKEKYLAAIGVRKTIELSVVFSRLINPEPGVGTASDDKHWSHKDLIRYLVSVRDDIPSEDMKRLRETPICPAEVHGGGQSTKLYRLNELHFPKPDLRDLNLRVLYWPEPLPKASSEASFLLTLGLLPHPSAMALIEIMANAVAREDTKLHQSALQYYLSNSYHNGYNKVSMASVTAKFLPLIGDDLSNAVSPRECFSNGQNDILGFKILRADLQAHASQLGVDLDPPIAVCVERLIEQPPLTKADAKKLFGYFAGRLNEIGANGRLAQTLGESLIVPIAKHEKIRFVAPRSCFLGDSKEYGEIFDYVDFGSDANTFLLKIGSKHEPTTFEIGGMLVREPGRLLNAIGADNYIKLLRRLADSVQGLKSDKTLWSSLKTVPCLLACREVVAQGAKNGNDLIDLDDDDDDEGSVMKEYSLAAARAMVLVNDFSSYNLFKAKLQTAPQEEAIENFYHALGTPWLSTLIDEEQTMGSLLPDQTLSLQLRKLIIERSRLFLHDHGTDAIRHDSRWLDKNLAIKAVTELQLRRTLRDLNVSHREKRTAALHRDKSNAILFVTANADFFEVSRALMILLLKRPKPQDYLALEMILDSDLRRLKHKGYNVDRILRQKAAESRIAEAEIERQRQVDEERYRQSLQAKAWKEKELAQSAHEEIDLGPEKPIPGAFEQSPEQPRLAAPDFIPEGIRKSGLFSKISRQLGMQPPSAKSLMPKSSDESKALMPPPGPAPAPGEKAPVNQDTKSRPSSSSPDTPEKVTAPHELAQKLSSAAQASRAHNSNTLFNPPSTSSIKEEKSYCDSIPDNDLREVGKTSNGIRIFLDSTIGASSTSDFLSEHIKPLNEFATMLVGIGEVFLLAPQTLHVYYNRQGPSIAFNTNGSLFFNLRYFLQLHWATGYADRGTGAAADRVRFDARVYWFVTMSHEMAHNLVKEHSSNHEFYTESFISQYLGNLLNKFGSS